MPILTESNCSVDKGSGAVLYHRSPELKNTIALRDDIKKLNQRLDEIESKIDEILKAVRGEE